MFAELIGVHISGDTIATHNDEPELGYGIEIKIGTGMYVVSQQSFTENDIKYSFELTDEEFKEFVNVAPVESKGITKPVTFLVSSSNGEIIVDKETGKCLVYRCGDEIADIVRFDIKEHCKYHNIEKIEEEDIDILDFGYWYKDGDEEKYEEPAHDWRELVIEMRKEDEGTPLWMQNDKTK